MGRNRTRRWRAHWGVGVVALRPLRPRRAGGPAHYRPLADEACAPLCAGRRLAARAVPPSVLGGGHGFLNGETFRTLRWRAHRVVGVVALRPLRPRRAGGPAHYRPLVDEACAPLCAARRLAARVVPPGFGRRLAARAVPRRRAISSQCLDAPAL